MVRIYSRTACTLAAVSSCSRMLFAICMLMPLQCTGLRRKSERTHAVSRCATSHVSFCVVVRAETFEDLLQMEDDLTYAVVESSGDAGQMVAAGPVVPSAIQLEILSRFSGLPVDAMRSLHSDALSAMWKKYTSLRDQARKNKSTTGEDLAKACDEASRRVLLRDEKPATMVCASVAMLQDKLVQLRGSDHLGCVMHD